MANNTTGLTRIIKAAGYSWKGCAQRGLTKLLFVRKVLRSLLPYHRLLLDVDAITRVLLIGSVLLVMIVEILNSAIEAVVDRIGSEFHELSGRAKDMVRGGAAGHRDRAYHLVPLTVYTAVLPALSSAWGDILIRLPEMERIS
jgi:diacylglycerol kinase (ATP)